MTGPVTDGGHQDGHVWVPYIGVEIDFSSARLAQSVERKALNLVVVGSSPTVGVFWR